MTIEIVTSLPLFDGASVLPGEDLIHERKRFPYVGRLANASGVMVLRAPSGEQISAPHLACELPEPWSVEGWCWKAGI